jgi:hypothetical protein
VKSASHSALSAVMTTCGAAGQARHGDRREQQHPRPRAELVPQLGPEEQRRDDGQRAADVAEDLSEHRSAPGTGSRLRVEGGDRRGLLRGEDARGHGPVEQVAQRRLRRRHGRPSEGPGPAPQREQRGKARPCDRRYRPGIAGVRSPRSVAVQERANVRTVAEVVSRYLRCIALGAEGPRAVVPSGARSKLP